tara:strand:+ start:7380 stop:8690 length:1311 start_codon:yes stop_codon:yes gene_type:complete
MNTSIKYIIDENVEHVKYDNLYYMNGEFLILTNENENIPVVKEIRLLGGPEHSGLIPNNKYTLIPKILTFDTADKLKIYINKQKLVIIKGVTNYFAHYYDHNVAHGLYDALYPSFLSLLQFYNEDMSYNNLIDIFKIPGWTFPGNASRDWLLDIFKDFSMGKNIYKNMFKPGQMYCFETLIAGSGFAGISSVNKMGIMPGKHLYALEKFRDRFYNVYDIKKTPKTNSNIKLLIIDSSRYSSDEKQILNNIKLDLLRDKQIDINYISWKDIQNFKQQIEIMNNCDIHIAGAGTTMLNFPFLNNNSIHINLGVDKMLPTTNPSLLEVNCCLLSNNIYCDFYDIYKYKQINYEVLKNMIQKNIDYLKNLYSNHEKNTIKKTIVPDYIIKWREICQNNSNTEYSNYDMNEIIDRMNGLKNPNLIIYRHPDMFIYKYYNYH